MALAHYYRILGLRTGASFDHVKLAYRNLVRLYHPDVNPGDQLAKEKFIQVTQAYRALVDARPEQVLTAPQAASTRAAKPKSSGPQASGSSATPPQAVAAPPAEAVELNLSPTPGGSEADQSLKVASFKQLRELFRGQRFPRAVALVEGLIQRFPEDPEIRQWHALTYYRWGHNLIDNGNPTKAEVCLKKARRVDPHNRSLHQALQHDFQRLDQLRQAPVPKAQ